MQLHCSAADVVGDLTVDLAWVVRAGEASAKLRDLLCVDAGHCRGRVLVDRALMHEALLQLADGVTSPPRVVGPEIG